MNLEIDRKRLVSGAVAICLIALGLLAWVFWPSAQHIPGADRVRQYANTRACLLTGVGGISDPVAAAAWAGLQGASATSRAMVSYLPVPGTASTAAAIPYVASLVQRRCAVIVAVGHQQVSAANSQAARYRQVHFIVIAQGRPGPAGSAASAVIRIAAGPAARVRNAVQAAVSAAING